MGIYILLIMSPMDCQLQVSSKSGDQVVSDWLVTCDSDQTSVSDDTTLQSSSLWHYNVNYKVMDTDWGILPPTTLPLHCHWGT